MSFSDYGLVHLVNRLNVRRSRVYKEKLRKLHDLEYEKPELKEEVKTIPEAQVKKTLEKLKAERPEKLRRRRLRDIMIIAGCILLLVALIQIFSFIVQFYFT